MSLLKNIFRSALAPAAPQPATGASAGMVQIGSAELPGARESSEATWRLLSAETGVQSSDYGDIARPGVASLFRYPPRRLLDIGCSSGAVGAGLKEADPSLWVWGCELNAQSADAAARRLDIVTRTPLGQWTDADVDRLRTVDTVLLLDVLEHMYNPWAQLEMLSQHLPADAQIVVSMPNVGHFSVMESLAAGTFPYKPTGILDVTHVRFFTLAGMQAMFRQAGLRIESTWILSATPHVEIAEFPAQVQIGKLLLEVDNAEEWQRLNAVQFGFRLKPAGGRAARRRAE